MTTKAVAAQPAAQVPDLVRTRPVLDIGAEDVALPRIYIGQYMSEHVKDQLVKAGSIFTATGPDDPDPQVLAAPESKEGVVLHVLGLRKGKSFSDGGELQLYDYNDPSAPENAWITYNYTIALPTVDEEVPYKWTLTRTGRPAARQLNTVLKKNEGRGPCWVNAFRFTAAKRENAKGEFFVARVAPVEADPSHVQIAERLGVMVSGATSEFNATGDEPSI